MGKKQHDCIVYSTNPDYTQENDSAYGKPSLTPQQQLLYIWLDSKGRKGKTVTLIKGFTGDHADLEKLATNLKKSCGTGGTVKDGEIIIQGNFREKILALLSEKGYRTKKAGR